MAARGDFINYPVARAAVDCDDHHKSYGNPTFRGLPLLLASNLMTYSSTVQKYFWNRAGFGAIPNLPGLVNEPYVFSPTVFPLRKETTDDASTESPSILPFSAELTTPQPSNTPGRFRSAADFHTLYASGASTPTQVAEALLPLVQRGKGSKFENAFIASDVDAIREAAAASTKRWAANAALGVLDGVPIAVKCDTALSGYVTTWGVRVDEQYQCFRDAQKESIYCVRKLQEAGAIVIAQTNMHEVGMDVNGGNPRTGTPINWYNQSYYPGGSSSGNSSALCAGLVPIAVGTDAGGSIRIPSAFCGTYGLKVTLHRTGTMPSTVTVMGPMAATVADLTIAYRLMAQPNPADPNTARFALSIPPSLSPSTKRYLVIPRAWVNLADEPVRAAFDKTIAWFIRQQHPQYEIIDDFPFPIPHLRAGQLAHAAICLIGAIAKARNRVRSAADPQGTRWKDLLNHPIRLILSMAQQCTTVEYVRFAQIRSALMSHMAHLFETYPGALLLTPTTPNAGWKRDPRDDRYGLSNGEEQMRTMLYVWLSNMTGTPSLSCPMGYLDPEQGEGKLPLGIMALGEWGAEEALLEWAGSMETYLRDEYPGGRQRPQEWVDVLGLVGKEENKAGGQGEEL